MCVPVKGKLEVERRRKFEDATTKTSSPRFGPFYRLHQRVCLSDGQSIKFDRREFRRREISISLRGGKPPPPPIFLRGQSLVALSSGTGIGFTIARYQTFEIKIRRGGCALKGSSSWLFYTHRVLSTCLVDNSNWHVSFYLADGKLSEIQKNFLIFPI